MQSKSDLRKIYSKSVFEDFEHDLATKSIIKNLDNFLSKATGNVGIYFPMDKEINLLPLMIKNNHLKYVLPKLVNDQMTFVHYRLGSMLQNNPDYPQIKEPKSDIEIMPKIVLVPGLAFDLKGNRLGRGRGHYDKYFGNNSADITKIGIIFNSNITENLPSESHDCKMDFLVSEKMILKL